MTFWVLAFIAEMLEVKGTLYFFDTFMEKRDGGYRNRYRFFVYCGVLYLAAVTGVWIGMLMYPDYTGYVFPKSGLL